MTIADVHRLTALAVAAAAAVVAVVVVSGAWLGRPGRFARDRGILAATVLVAFAIASGALILVLGGRPADPLHFLYALVAILALPVARFWGVLARRRALAVGCGALILVVLVVRLWQTG
jgi:hypothetical protein